MEKYIQYLCVMSYDFSEFSAKLSVVSNFPFLLVMPNCPWCQIVWCQIVQCQIVCGAKLSGAKLSAVSNCSIYVLIDGAGSLRRRM